MSPRGRRGPGDRLRASAPLTGTPEAVSHVPAAWTEDSVYRTSGLQDAARGSTGRGGEQRGTPTAQGAAARNRPSGKWGAAPPSPPSSPAVPLRFPHPHLIFRSLSLFSLSRFLRMRMNWLKKCSWSFRFWTSRNLWSRPCFSANSVNVVLEEKVSLGPCWVLGAGRWALGTGRAWGVAAPFPRLSC